MFNKIFKIEHNRNSKFEKIKYKNKWQLWPFKPIWPKINKFKIFEIK